MRRQSCVDRCQGSIIIIRGFALARIDVTTRINEILKRLDTITSLSRKHAIGGGVLHEQRVDGCVPVAVGGHGSTTVGLVDIDFALSSHETKVRK